MGKKNLLRLIAVLFLLVTKSYAQIQFAPYTAIPTGSSPDAVAIGDVNNDGLNDVVVGNGFYFDNENDYRILVYLQNNSGTLNLPVKYLYSSASLGITSLRIIDINNDSLNDIVLGFGTKIGFFYQNSLGGLDPLTTLETGLSVRCLEVADLNGDNLAEIAISSGYQTTFKVFFSNSGR